MPDVVQAVRDRLRTVADPERAPAMQRYMKSEMPYLGVSSRPLATACREVYAAQRLPDRAAWERAVRRLWDEATVREERYAAIALVRHRAYRAFQGPATLPLYRHLVVTGGWWDYVDTLAAHEVGGVLLDFPSEVAPVVRAWAVDDDLWLRRSAILCQLLAKDRTDVALLTDTLEPNLEGSTYGSEFFVRKAVGWALRQHARVDPDWVRAFVAEHDRQLSGLSRREALKHLRRPAG